MLTISKNLLWPRDLESFKGGNFNTFSLVDCYATDEADLCPVTAIICAIEQFLPRIVAPVARIEWLV